MFLPGFGHRAHPWPQGPRPQVMTMWTSRPAREEEWAPQRSWAWNELPSGKLTVCELESHHFSWVNWTISMAIFNSKLLNDQRVPSGVVPVSLVVSWWLPSNVAMKSTDWSWLVHWSIGPRMISDRWPATMGDRDDWWSSQLWRIKLH